jgi:adenosylhomocysteine nucleosidase
MAAMFEAKPFVNGMRLTEYEATPFLIFKGENILLAISGIGKINAAFATAYCCLKFHPSSIINLGAAGAVTNALQRGDVLHIHRTIEYDRPDFKTGEPCQYEPDIMTGFSTAVLATSDRVVTAHDDRKKVAVYADLADMEGASIVCGCKKFDTPSYLFKFVSDTLDDTDETIILEQIKKNRSPFYNFISSSVIPLFFK